MEIVDLFKIMIVVQLFYAFAITGLVYATPADAKQYVTSFSEVATTINLENVSSQVQTSLERQRSIPVIELGALVFYSGNIILDLFLNFFTAIPQMLGLLINGLQVLFSIDGYLFAMVEIFSSVIITVLYFLALIQLLLRVRSGSGVV